MSTEYRRHPEKVAELQNKRILVIGRGSGIAYATAHAAIAEGAQIIAAGRHPDDLTSAYQDQPVQIENVDVTDETSVRNLAQRIGRIDHVVTTASARARGQVADLTAETVAASFATKAVGAILLAKHLAPIMPADGSFVLSSGVTATHPQVGMIAVSGTNGAVDAITRSLAVELAPIRVNAVAPGTIDTGAYDALGRDAKVALFAARSASNPAGRVGLAEDVAQVILFALTADFLTGVSIPVDGGETLT